MRLHKFISRSGLTSRRKAEILISEGKVKVNGKIVQTAGVIVDPENDVIVVGRDTIEIPPIRWVKMNKPPGVLTTAQDDRSRPTIYDILTPDMRSLRYVGRLDYLTEGLLILTNDGDVANRLQHPSSEVEREYDVAVEGKVSNTTLMQLRAGVELDDGFARPTRVEISKKSAGETYCLTIVIKEGRKREIRRLMAAVGHPVAHLRRTRFGSLKLGPLKTGTYEDLSHRDIKALIDCISLV